MLLGFAAAATTQALVGLVLPLVTERFSPALLSLIQRDHRRDAMRLTQWQRIEKLFELASALPTGADNTLAVERLVVDRHTDVGNVDPLLGTCSTAPWGPTNPRSADAECEPGRAQLLKGLSVEGRTTLARCFPVYRGWGLTTAASPRRPSDC